MAFDEALAGRIRARLAGEPALSERKMFSGVTFMINGNMMCAVRADDLLVRVGPEQSEAALAKPHVSRFVMRGKPMKGYVVVATKALGSDAGLAAWLDMSRAFDRTLKPK